MVCFLSTPYASIRDEWPPCFCSRLGVGVLSRLDKLIFPSVDTAPKMCPPVLSGETLGPTALKSTGLSSFLHPSRHHLLAKRSALNFAAPWSPSSALKQANSFWAPKGTRISLISKLKCPWSRGKVNYVPLTYALSSELLELACLLSEAQNNLPSSKASPPLNSVNMLPEFSFFLLTTFLVLFVLPTPKSIVLFSFFAPKSTLKDYTLSLYLLKLTFKKMLSQV